MKPELGVESVDASHPLMLISPIAAVSSSTTPKRREPRDVQPHTNSTDVTDDVPKEPAWLARGKWSEPGGPE